MGVGHAISTPIDVRQAIGNSSAAGGCPRLTSAAIDVVAHACRVVDDGLVLRTWFNDDHVGRRLSQTGGRVSSAVPASREAVR